MLIGSYDAKINKKNEIKIPKKLQSLGDKVILGIDLKLNCIIIIPLDMYKKFKKQDSKQKYFSYSSHIYDINEQGLLKIDQNLLNISGIVEDCVFLGMQNYVELWEKTKLNEYFDNIDITKIEETLKKISL